MVGEVILQKGEEIYAEGGLSPEMWEEMVHDGLLGKMAPNIAIVRAIVAQLRNIEDEILRDIVIESIKAQDGKDRTMRKEPMVACATATRGTEQLALGARICTTRRIRNKKRKREFIM